MTSLAKPKPSGAGAASRLPHPGRGFTLVDLVIVIAIVAVMATIAAPSFAAFIASQRAVSAASNLYGALVAARSEATLRSTNVTLAPKDGDWRNGWTIADPAIEGRNILVQGAIGVGTVSGPATVVYQRSGRVRGTAPSFTLITAAGSAIAKRCVQVDLNGRPSIQTC